MTPPKRITISAGIDQTTNSARPSKDSSRLRLARAFDDLYHQANPNVARITGSTTTSIIAVELSKSSSSADAIGPCGSSTPVCWQEATRTAAPVISHRSKRERRPRLCPVLDAQLGGGSEVGQRRLCMLSPAAEVAPKTAPTSAKSLTTESSENAVGCQSR